MSVGMKVLLVCSFAMIAACSASRPEQAERDYNFMASQGSSDAEMCEAARRAQEAYRASQNAAKYKDWRLTADVKCRRAEQAA